MTEKLVIEYHYDDGDVGAHPATAVETVMWQSFSADPSHVPSHVVIRPNTSEGQDLSNRLLNAAREHHENRCASSYANRATQGGPRHAN